MLLNLFLSIFSAILLILAFPKPDLGFLAWFALVPWFFALQRKNSHSAFFLSYLVGLVFFSGILYWVTYVSILGFTVLVLYLALYFAVFGLAFSWYRKVYRIPLRKSLLCPLGYKSYRRAIFLINNLFIIPCIWVALEYIRSHLFTGFSWAILGYSQYSALPFIQISDITGAYGVSFLIVLVNVGIWHFLSLSLRAPPVLRSPKGEGGKGRLPSEALAKEGSNLLLRLLRRYAPRNDGSYPIYWAICLLSSVIIVLSYGYFKLNSKPQGQDIRVAVIQGNIPQKMKWDPQHRDFIVRKYCHLTEQAARKGPDIIIWPETSVPGYLEDDPELLKELSSLSKSICDAYLLVGTPQQQKRKTYNSATLLLDGKIIQRYDKLHLVPFGEFIPWPEFFSRFSFAGLIGNFIPGEDYTVFSLARPKAKIRFSALICFEDVFAHFVRRFAKKEAQFLVNMTNDAWFEDSSEPYQHLQTSVFRAVENRVNVVRSANTGLSCFINPWGKVLSRVSDQLGRDVLVEGYAVEDLQIFPMPSFYTAFGDIFAWFCLCATVLSLLLRRKHAWQREPGSTG